MPAGIVKVGLQQSNIEVMFGSQAGDGSLTTGDAIAAIFKRSGFAVYTYKDFPSRIRGESGGDSVSLRDSVSGPAQGSPDRRHDLSVAGRGDVGHSAGAGLRSDLQRSGARAARKDSGLPASGRKGPAAVRHEWQLGFVAFVSGERNWLCH